MLQVAAIREQTDKVLEGLSKRNFKEAENLIAQLLEKDNLRKTTQKTLDDRNAKAKADAKQIGELIKAQKTAEANGLRAAIAEAKDMTKTIEASLILLEKEVLELLYKIPNVPHEKVPAGMGADDNLKVSETGQIPQLDADALPHWELIKKYDIIDFDLGNKISGAGFPVYKGKGRKTSTRIDQFLFR